jgi:predicted dienelactone hydrolase
MFMSLFMSPFSRRPARRLVTLAAAVLLAPVAAAQCTDPPPHAAGRRDVTVSRPNGSTFTATLHYPATSEGVNAPFDAGGGPYPIVSFGHGFLSPVTLYQSTLQDLARNGYFAIASQSQGGLFPNHSAFAADLRYSVDWLVVQNGKSGQYPGKVAVDAIAFSGHSMGGGAAMLAAKDDPRERALVTLAAANTNPSSNAAMSSIVTPTMLIVGSNDSIVPPNGSATVQYANAVGPRQIRSITGGGHCGFIDSSIIGCDNAPLSRDQQLAITKTLLRGFLDLVLRGQECAWDPVWGPGAASMPGVEETIDARMTVSAGAGPVEGPPGGTATVTVSVTNAMSLPRSFAWEGEGVSFSPALVGPVAPGVSATATATIPIPADATAEFATVLWARSLDDGSTRAWVSVIVRPVDPGVFGDLNGDGTVDGADLTILLSSWGACAGCPADLNDDGTVDANDLANLLAAWR